MSVDVRLGSLGLTLIRPVARMPTPPDAHLQFSAVIRTMDATNQRVAACAVSVAIHIALPKIRSGDRSGASGPGATITAAASMTAPTAAA